MKFSCDSCSARYEISDEKVAGNVLKVRCRRCGHTITVAAPQLAPVVAEAPSALATEQWYYALAGETFGPYGEDELIERFQSGRVGDEAYVWQPSFPEWKPAIEIPVFNSSIAQFRRSRRATKAPATMQLNAEDVERFAAARREPVAPRRATVAGSLSAISPSTATAPEQAKPVSARAESVALAAESRPTDRTLERPLGEAPAPRSAEAEPRPTVRRRTTTAGVSFDDLKARLEGRSSAASPAGDAPSPAVTAAPASAPDAAPEVDTSASALLPDANDQTGEFASATVAPPVSEDPEPTGEFNATPAVESEARVEAEAIAETSAEENAVQDAPAAVAPAPAAVIEQESVAAEPEAPISDVSTSGEPAAIEMAVEEELSEDDLQDESLEQDDSETPPSLSAVVPAPETKKGEETSQPVVAQAVQEKEPTAADEPSPALKGAETRTEPTKPSPESTTESADESTAALAPSAAAAVAARAEKKDLRRPTVDEDVAGWFSGGVTQAGAAVTGNRAAVPTTTGAPPAVVQQAKSSKRSPALLIAIVLGVIVLIAVGVLTTRDTSTPTDPAPTPTANADTIAPEGTGGDEAVVDEASAVAEGSVAEGSDGSGLAEVALISEDQMRLLLIRGHRAVNTGIDAGILASMTATGLSASELAARRAAEAEVAAQALDRGTRRGPTMRSSDPIATAPNDEDGATAEPAQRTGFFADMGGTRSVTTRDRNQQQERSGPPAEHFAGGLSGFVSDGLERCAQRQRIEEGELSVGRVTLRLTVRPTGQVSRVTMDDAVMGTTFSSCVQGVSRRWRFDGFDGEDVTLVRAYIVQ